MNPEVPKRVLEEDECGGVASGALTTNCSGRLNSEAPIVLEQAWASPSARLAVDANGGRIHARNLQDMGCVFIVDLPRLPTSCRRVGVAAVLDPAAVASWPNGSVRIDIEGVISAIVIVCRDMASSRKAAMWDEQPNLFIDYNGSPTIDNPL